MGRIGDVVREQAGLAYYAHSSVSGGVGPGPLTVHAGVIPTKEEKAIGLIPQELTTILEGTGTGEEFRQSQKHPSRRRWLCA